MGAAGGRFFLQEAEGPEMGEGATWGSTRLWHSRRVVGGRGGEGTPRGPARVLVTRRAGHMGVARGPPPAPAPVQAPILKRLCDLSSEGASDA